MQFSCFLAPELDLVWVGVRQRLYKLRTCRRGLAIRVLWDGKVSAQARASASRLDGESGAVSALGMDASSGAMVPLASVGACWQR